MLVRHLVLELLITGAVGSLHPGANSMVGHGDVPGPTKSLNDLSTRCKVRAPGGGEAQA